MSRRSALSTIGKVSVGAAVVVVGAAGYLGGRATSPSSTTTVTQSVTTSATSSSSVSSSSGESSSAVAAAGGGTIVFTYPMNFGSVDPVYDTGWADDTCVLACYDSLVTVNPPYNTYYVPHVATSWTASTDAKTFTFKLNPNITFQSGNPLTADDVVFTFTRHFNAKEGIFGARLRNVMQAASQIQKVDQYTVQFNLSTAYPPFLALVAEPAFGIEDSKLVTAHQQNDDGKAWLSAGNSAGSGPFSIASWNFNQKLVLQRWDNYWLTPAPTAQFVHVNNQDSNSMAIALQGGEADFAYGIDAQTLSGWIKSPQNGVKVDHSLALQSVQLFLNVKNVTAFADPLVGQAMRYMINYPNIIQNLFLNYAIPLSSPFYQGMLGYGGEPYYSYNPTKAQQLLSQSTFPKGGFNFTLNVRNDSKPGAFMPNVALAVASDLAKFNITANVTPVDGSQIDSMDNKGSYECLMTWYGADALVDEENVSAFLRPGGGYGMDGTGWQGYGPLITLANQALVEPDVTKATAEYEQIGQMLATNGPFVFIAQNPRLVGERTDFYGWNHSELNWFDLYPMFKSS